MAPLSEGAGGPAPMLLEDGPGGTRTAEQGNRVPPGATSVWQRDVAPNPICSCQHPFAEHNIETKRMRCSRNSGRDGECLCTGFDLWAYEWTERRRVREIFGETA